MSRFVAEKLDDSASKALRSLAGREPCPALQRLRASLNPFSRFDFGLLPGLPQPGDWQANEHRREAV